MVGQTPPPYGGQAIMIENMLRANFSNVRFFHLRMAFSSDMNEVGKFKITKVIKLIQLISAIYYFRLRHGITALYYPPAPPQKVPMLRDVIILNSTRWLFKTTVFHFHAAGISEMHHQTRGMLRKLYERAYFYPEISIRLSEYNPEDGKYLRTKKEFLVPNGLDDIAGPFLNVVKENKRCVLLSVGVICESKGTLVLLESARILASTGYQFTLHFMGRFESKAFQETVYGFIQEHNLKNYVEFIGVQTGEQKQRTFSQADIFCFPTFFEAETFGLVALEAMQFKLPVVASRWRGVPSVVKDQVNGFLVSPKNANEFAEKIEILLKDPLLRKQMGEEGRKLFIQKFTKEKFTQNLQKAFSAV